MNEKLVRASLMRVLREDLPASFVLFRHEGGHVHAGIADISVTGLGHTTWVEVKLAAPDLRSRGIQDEMMRRLDRAGRAVYVIYSMAKDGLNKQTHIVYPRNLSEWTTSGKMTDGFDHRFVANFILRNHS